MFQFLWSPFSMLHWGSACTGGWSWVHLDNKNFFPAGQCGVLIILAKARCAAMSKALPQSQPCLVNSYSFPPTLFPLWVAGHGYPEEEPAYLSQILRWARAAQRAFLCWVAGECSSFAGVDEKKQWAPGPQAAVAVWPASPPVHSESLPPLPPHCHPSVTCCNRAEPCPRCLCRVKAGLESSHLQMQWVLGERWGRVWPQGRCEAIQVAERPPLSAMHTHPLREE